MVPNLMSFKAFEKELFMIEDRIVEFENHLPSYDLSYAQLLVLHKQCGRLCESIYNSSKYGFRRKSGIY
jgi:hypothetical protein